MEYTVGDIKGLFSEWRTFDEATSTVEGQGETLEAALEHASIELDLPVRLLDFEVVKRGKKGLLGKAKNMWVIRAYKKTDEAELDKDANDASFEEEDAANAVERREGALAVSVRPDGVYLRVRPPLGQGRPVSNRAALEALHSRFALNIHKNIVHKVVEKMDNIYIKVADIEFDSSASGALDVQIRGDSEVFIFASEASQGGSNITSERIEEALQMNGVTGGYRREAIDEFDFSPVYNAPYLVARNILPKNGSNAYLEYKFDVNPRSHISFSDVEGNIDYKDLRLFQNVNKGDLLAVKIPAERGVDGEDIYGAPIKSYNGSDINIPFGENVSVAPDGITLIADCDGQVALEGGKVVVHRVLLIPGDVNASTGHIDSNGSIIVKGNIEDGYKVTAKGSIEIFGTVGRSHVTSQQNIVIHHGVNGGEQSDVGILEAKGAILAKFVTNATVYSGKNLVVTDGILNSRVEARERVICSGKRGQIAGGHIIAKDEISAHILGSQGDVETVVEVGIDPKLRRRKNNTSEDIFLKESLLSKMKKDFRSVELLKESLKGKLPEDKLEIYNKLKEDIDSTQPLLNKLYEKLKNINTEIEMFEKEPCYISVGETTHVGVRIIIRESTLDVTMPYEKPLSFSLVEGCIDIDDYIPVDEAHMSINANVN